VRFIVILFTLLLLSASASAEPESILLTHEGVPGMWFPMAKADLLLEDVRRLPLIEAKVELLELKIRSQTQYVLLLRQDIEITEQISDKWKTAFDEQLKVTEAQAVYYKDEIQSLKKWYRAPALWFSVGVLITGALAVGLNYGLAETR